MSGDADRMAETMGFTSFGQLRRRGRGRVKQVTSESINARGLPQLMPGTELVAKCTELSVDSIEKGPYGVVSLLCRDTDSDARDPLDAALDGTARETSEAENHVVPYSSVLDDLEQEKRKFNGMEHSQFLRARGSTNGFEPLGRHRFLNRSAMKLVTLDHIFQWTCGAVNRHEPFSFADICGGPGGFSEYLLWRGVSSDENGEREHDRGHRGYGMTLKDAANECDWRLSSKYRKMFTSCYGEDGTGNIYSVANMHKFRDVVRARQPSGVDLVVADGGFLDARSQSNQVRDLMLLV
uniref:Cap-specific mRNA (nucleoside-2'-O-)-methyltransferase 1 n=1 Tax=Hyaloperonospora arabidopsidis (strain Emoy2) TaxID=559515 RepID=M4BGD7_HYAAE